MAEMHAAVAGGVARRLQLAAHSLKGGVASFAAGSAYEAALRLEQMACAGDLAAAGRGGVLKPEAPHRLDSLPIAARAAMRGEGDESGAAAFSPPRLVSCTQPRLAPFYTKPGSPLRARETILGGLRRFKRGRDGVLKPEFRLDSLPIAARTARRGEGDESGAAAFSMEKVVQHWEPWEPRFSALPRNYRAFGSVPTVPTCAGGMHFSASRGDTPGLRPLSRKKAQGGLRGGSRGSHAPRLRVASPSVSRPLGETRISSPPILMSETWI
jgi:hypothetical protein